MLYTFYSNVNSLKYNKNIIFQIGWHPAKDNMFPSQVEVNVISAFEYFIHFPAKL